MNQTADVSSRRYGDVAVPAAWIAAAAAVATTAFVLADKGSRPWGDHGPIMLDGDSDPGPYIFFGALTMLFLVIATRLHRHEPSNSLARLSAVFAIAVTGLVTTDMLSSWLIAFRGVSDVALVLRLLGSLWFGLGWSTMLLVLVRFPTGRRLSPRWRIVEVVGIIGAGLLVLAAFSPENGDIEPFVNPIAIGPLAEIAGLGYLGWTLLSAAVPFAVLSILVRAVRARGDERQQLKWVLFGLLLGWGGAFLITLLTGQGDADGSSRGVLADSELAVSVGEALVPFFIFAMPATLIVAMFRYRLWDIDRVIRRTAIYTVVLVVLGAVYAGGVIATGRLTRSLTGGSAGDVGVALSTLVAAGLFQPVQRRVKDIVDRRFNRRRAQTMIRVEQFHASLRDELELASITKGVEGVAAEVLQPATISVWLPGSVSPQPSEVRP